MRAAYIEAHGAAESIRVGNLPDPSPDPGEVLVRVKAVSFNPIDLYLRSGAVPMPMAFPYVVGADLAGTVERVGAGVTRFKPGDRVWGSNQGLLGRQGVASELAAVGEEWLYPTPENVTDTQAAAIALVGITAHLGLFERGRLQRGETAYVSGGSGGVGSIVIQMARAAGARIATTAGGPHHVRDCLALGADLAIDYKADDVPARLRDFAPDGIDVWYETQREPNLMTAVPLLRRGGRIVLIAGRDATPSFPLGSFYPRDCSILGFAMFNATPDSQRRAADDINRWMSEGKLAPRIGQTFPLAQAAEAQALLEANTIHRAGTLSGKVVVTIP
jgi:NADPH2:quinone reductase